MILCSGEALIDMLPRESTASEPCFAPHAGGSVFNTAVALARLGAPSSLFTGLSNDLFGQTLEATLKKDGVGTDLAARSDRPTTLAFVQLTDGHASYAFYDENTAGRMITEADLPTSDAISAAKALFFGGISLMVEPCAKTYQALLEREKGSRPIMLDPNIRPSFIADQGVYRERLTRLIEAADIIKVSDEDLTWIMGPGDPDEHARSLVKQGPRIVCVTRGAEGVTAYMPGGKVQVPAPRATVVDTVGAGDTFNAGLLAGLNDANALSIDALSNPDIVRDALDLGVRAAAITVSRAGANPPTRSELP